MGAPLFGTLGMLSGVGVMGSGGRGCPSTREPVTRQCWNKWQESLKLVGVEVGGERPPGTGQAAPGPCRALGVRKASFRVALLGIRVGLGHQECLGAHWPAGCRASVTALVGVDSGG